MEHTERMTNRWKERKVEVFTADWKSCAAAGPRPAAQGWRPEPPFHCGGAACGSCEAHCSRHWNSIPSWIQSCLGEPCRRNSCTSRTSSRCLKARARQWVMLADVLSLIAVIWYDGMFELNKLLVSRMFPFMHVHISSFDVAYCASVRPCCLREHHSGAMG